MVLSEYVPMFGVVRHESDTFDSSPMNSNSLLPRSIMPGRLTWYQIYLRELGCVSLTKNFDL